MRPPRERSPRARARPLANALAALVAGAGLVGFQEHGAPAPPPARIALSVHETQAGERWSVLCADAPLAEVLRALAKKAGLALEGTELVPSGAKVSVELERRPLEELLEYVLGSAGLAHRLAGGSLVVVPSAGEAEELLRRAESAWQRVEAGGGEASSAARALLARGHLAEVRGDHEGAYRLYSELAADEPSPETAEALWRAGRILEELGHWSEAAQHFRTLAAMEGAARRLAVRARLELAAVSIELGDARSALHLVNSLDLNFPAEDGRERAERALVRARAQNACREPVEALRALEENAVDAVPALAARALEVRAVAFEELGFAVEAARAWLLCARDAGPAGRAEAFERAARLSLEAGDDLGTLFICREAARAGADQGLGSWARTARAHLGLDEPDSPASIRERLELAERELAAGELASATDLFEGLYLARGALDEDSRARVLAGWARCVHRRTGLEPALALLSQARESIESLEARRRLDIAAAAMLEEDQLFERAALAYEGRY
jgi:tetratricopeptide (TPR) repeat protein